MPEAQIISRRETYEPCPKCTTREPVFKCLYVEWEMRDGAEWPVRCVCDGCGYTQPHDPFDIPDYSDCDWSVRQILAAGWTACEWHPPGVCECVIRPPQPGGRLWWLRCASGEMSLMSDRDRVCPVCNRVIDWEARMSTREAVLG